MRLHDEYRELQIRLAELQADVQINLTICFGLLALAFAAIIGLQQIYFTSPPEEIVVKNSALVSMVGCIIIILLVTRSYLKKALDAREQMKELRNAEKL